MDIKKDANEKKVNVNDLFHPKGEIPRTELKPFTVYDPRGKVMKITGEYDLGGGSCFYIAEEIPEYGTVSQDLS